MADCGAEDDVAEDDVAEDDDSEDELVMIMLTPWQLISKSNHILWSERLYPNSLYVKGKQGYKPVLFGNEKLLNNIRS